MKKSLLFLLDYYFIVSLLNTYKVPSQTLNLKVRWILNCLMYFQALKYRMRSAQLLLATY